MLVSLGFKVQLPSNILRGSRSLGRIIITRLGACREHLVERVRPLDQVRRHAKRLLKLQLLCNLLRRLEIQRIGWVPCRVVRLLLDLRLLWLVDFVDIDVLFPNLLTLQLRASCDLIVQDIHWFLAVWLDDSLGDR